MEAPLPLRRSRARHVRASGNQASPEPDVRPHAHRAEADVQVAEAHREETEPCPPHVPPIETADARIGSQPNRHTRKLIDAAANDMTHRVTTEQEAAQKSHVGCKNK